MLVQCQMCSGAVSDTAQKCPKCAAAPAAFLGQAVKCRECGADYLTAYPECRNCGALRSAAAPIPVAQPLPEPAQSLIARGEPVITQDPLFGTSPIAAPIKKKRREAGAITYILTFIIANILVNGFSGAVGAVMARGITYEEAVSVQRQLLAMAIGSMISIIGFAIVYGLSRAMTRMVPIKALPWMLASVFIGAVLSMGQVYGIVSDVRGVDEARSIAFQSFVFAALGGFLSMGGFLAIFRNKV